MKTKNHLGVDAMVSRQVFEMQSYVGSEIAQLRPGGERPPRSAKFVVSTNMGGGPGGGDYRTYLICTDRERSGWTLWLSGADFEVGGELYCRMAWGRPYRGYSAREAAKLLLGCSLRDEMTQGPLEAKNVHVAESGLLTVEDMATILSTLPVR